MSKRYGRNQKRRHREEIARLKEALLTEQLLAKYFSGKYREAKQQIEDITDVIESVCEYSIALPPKKYIGSEPRESLRLERMRERPTDMPMPGRVPIISSFCEGVVSVHALRVYLEQHVESLSLAVHLEYSAGGHSVYMISKGALLATPEDKLIMFTAVNLVKHFRAHFKKIY